MKIIKLEIEVGPKHAKVVAKGLIAQTRFERAFDVSFNDVQDENLDMGELVAKLVGLVHKRVRDKFLGSLEEEGI